MKLIEIEWLDSYGITASWEHVGDIECKPTSILSVGYVLEDHEGYYVLASNITHPDSWNDKQVSGCIAIPKCCIVNERELK